MLPPSAYKGDALVGGSDQIKDSITVDDDAGFGV